MASYTKSAIRAVAALLLFGVPAVGAAPAKRPAPPAGKPSVAVLDNTGLAKEIRSARGKVVLINYWASYCPPCKEELPQLLQVRRQYQAQGLKMLLISADEPKDIPKLVVPVLKKVKADFPTYIKPPGDAIRYIETVDANWDGALPRTFLIDRNGRVRDIVGGEIDFKRLQKSLKKLLAEKVDPSAPADGLNTPDKGLLTLSNTAKPL